MGVLGVRQCGNSSFFSAIPLCDRGVTRPCIKSFVIDSHEHSWEHLLSLIDEYKEQDMLFQVEFSHIRYPDSKELKELAQRQRLDCFNGQEWHYSFGSQGLTISFGAC